MEHLLAQYILYEPSNLTRDFVHSLVANATAKKGDICTYVTHFYCVHALTPNVWILEQLKQYYHQIDKCKKNDKDILASLCYGLFHLLANVDKKEYMFHNEADRSDLFRTHITNVIHTSSNGDNPDLVSLKDVLNAEVYSLLNIMYDGFLYSVESNKVLQMCFVILRYLITLAPRNYYAQDKKMTMDIYDIMFLVCISYAQNVHCPKPVSDYIILTKDLFYYQVKKRDKVKRVNLLFYLIYVIVNKHVTEQMIDYDGMRYLERLNVACVACEEGNNGNNGNNGKHEKNEKNEKNDKHERRHEKNDKNDKNEKHERRHEKNEKQRKEDASSEAVTEKCKYLYIYTEYDEATGYQIQAERERNQMIAKLMRTSTKDIEVDSLLSRDPNEYINVAKLGR